jgi:DNA-binding response OmpR family regulator
MKNDRKLNSGVKPGNFALMRKPSSAVEKAAPGAQRILSGIVADTLALAIMARSFRIVVVSAEEGPLQSISIVIKSQFKNSTVLTFEHPEQAWQELLHTDPDLLITDDRMPGLSGREIVQRLLNQKANYPVIMFSGMETDDQLVWVQECASRGLNITFLNAPFDIQSLVKALKTALIIPRNKTSAPRIVLLDDEDCLREILEIAIQQCFKNATVRSFSDGDEALQELLHTPPDLLITDINHLGLNGREMLPLLARKKVTFPILVTSGNLTEKDVRQNAGTGLNVSFLAKPFKNADFSKFLETALKTPRGVIRSNAETPPVVANADLKMRTSNENAEPFYQKYLIFTEQRKYSDARRFLRKAAEMEHKEAMYFCGIDYMSGDGFPQDNKQAFYWIRKAAEHGHEYAQFHLGVIYKSEVFPGNADVSQDLPEAYKWFKLATEQNEKWEKSVIQLSAALTSGQLQEGERRYREFQIAKK